MSDRLSTSLQESVLTVLCYDDVAGQQIANMIDSALFQGDYRVLAERAIEFWRKHKAAPKEHMPDLVGEILDDPKNKNTAETYGVVLNSMYETHACMNVRFVMSQLTNFIRIQRLKATIEESARKIHSKDELAVEEVEEIWSQLLKTREVGMDAGIRLNEIDRVLAHLEKQATEFSFGISALDTRYIVPRRGTLSNLHGAPGDGKTWFLVNTGKHALMAGKKVLHVTLEFDAEDVMQRYYQALFSCTDRAAERLTLTSFLRHSNSRLRDFGEYKITPEFSFESNTIKMELESRIMEILGIGLSENLIIKRWAPNRITPRDVEAFLDYLDANEHFLPDIILFDYPRLFKIDMRNPRLSIGEQFVNTRALLVERDMAGVSVHQFSKEGARAEMRDMTHGSEAWDVNQTCDIVMSLSKTKSEKDYGLARILVDKARKARDAFQILITQSYDIGQFCLDSMILDPNYKKIFDRMDGGDEEEQEDDE